MKKASKLVRPTFFAASITTTYAVSGGNITSDGGAKVTDWGVIWSTTEDLTGDFEQIVISGDAGGMYFSSKNENRSHGLAVRCIMDN